MPTQADRLRRFGAAMQRIRLPRFGEAQPSGAAPRFGVARQSGEAPPCGEAQPSGAALPFGAARRLAIRISIKGLTRIRRALGQFARASVFYRKPRCINQPINAAGSSVLLAFTTAAAIF